MVEESKRIFYLDAIRAFAILCVIVLHVSGHLGELVHYDINTIYSLSGIFESFSINFCEIGVDLFLMLSGALLLGREWGLKEFLVKRIPRITKPFVFWALVTAFLLIISSYFIPSLKFVKHFGLFDILKVIYDTFLFQAPGTEVFWFFWTILGVYLVLPVLNKWILHSDLWELEYFMVFWVINTIYDYTLLMECPIQLSYFISPIAFAILGYYLRYTDRKIFNNKYLALLLVILPSLVMLAYSYHVVDVRILFKFHRYSILVILLAAGVFCLFKNIDYFNSPHPVLKKAVTSVAISSYGMYLTHSQLIMVFRKVLHLNYFNFAIEYLLLFAVGFVGSWLVIYLLSKVPFLKEFVS